MFTRIKSMLLLETAASEWWSKMGAREQQAYLDAHPNSRMDVSKTRMHGAMRHYLGSDGQERDSAARFIQNKGGILPEEPRARSSRFQQETVDVRNRRRPGWNTENQNPPSGPRKMHAVRDANGDHIGDVYSHYQYGMKRHYGVHRDGTKTSVHSDPAMAEELLRNYHRHAQRQRADHTSRSWNKRPVHTGMNAGQRARDMRDRFGWGAGETTNDGIEHVANAKSAKKMHDYLMSHGWKHDRFDNFDGRFQKEIHDYQHPDGGHVRHVRVDGSDSLTGRDRHRVYVN